MTPRPPRRMIGAAIVEDLQAALAQFAAIAADLGDEEDMLAATGDK